MAVVEQDSPYHVIGGEEGVLLLVKTFYDIVESDPIGAPLVTMHNRGHGLAHARQAQFEFLSGFLGGPQLYVEHHGHSNVRKMHEHLEIVPVERDAWLNCMDKALAALPVPEAMHRLLMSHFSRVAGVLTTKSS
ncbi:MAG: group II truncated hemoglobin [Rhizobiales bacterium]|nr:group II truncated hemoglobin [Hyphomicrobiales bacterium]MBI3673743.1 group II truncated hemoglobin [Hyphomicrobiales bacterium]